MFLQELLSLSLANRSACSFHLGCYEEAITDIHHALALKYPKSKKIKVFLNTLCSNISLSLYFQLYLRLCKCHLKLNQPSKARPILQIAKSLLEEKENQKNDFEEILKIETVLEKFSEKGKTKLFVQCVPKFSSSQKDCPAF